MRTTLLSLAIAGVALMSAAYAHPATEQYIPIGESPGGGTVQGRAETAAVPASGGTEVIRVDAAGADQNFVVGPRTRVYVDHSAEGRPNTVGTLDDVQPGRVIEVRADPQTRYAEWIKVRP